MAGILVQKDLVTLRRQQWAKSLNRSATEFRQKLYADARADPSFSRGSSAALLQTPYPQRSITPGRFSKLASFHCAQRKRAGVFSPSTYGCRLRNRRRPGQTVLRLSQGLSGGAALARHTDREQCEFSMTFCSDYSPEPRSETPWPIRLHPKGSTVTVFKPSEMGCSTAVVLCPTRDRLFRKATLPHQSSSTTCA